MILTFVILGLTILLFSINRWPMELVALISLAALLLGGLVSVEEALAGFGNPTVITIAALFVIGGGLFHTGVADWIAQRLLRLAGPSYKRLLLIIVAGTAVLSAFLSNTGTVAVLLPAVVSASRQIGVRPASLLLPMAFAAQLGGLLTLVGTPPNIVLSNTLAEQGSQPFSFFEIGMLGVPVLIVYLLYLLFVVKAPEGSGAGEEGAREAIDAKELRRLYDLDKRIFRVRVRVGSPWIGKTIREIDLPGEHGVQVLHLLAPDEVARIEGERGWEAVFKGRSPVSRPLDPDAVIREQALLVLVGAEETIHALSATYLLGFQTGDFEDNLRGRLLAEMGAAEILLTPRSKLAGSSLAQLHFADRYRVRVLGIMRAGKPVPSPHIREPLQFGDALMVYGKWHHIELLAQDTANFIVLGKPVALTASTALNARSYLAIAALALMVVSMVTGLFPLVTAALLTAMIMLLGGCLEIEQAYGSISWQSLILIAAMLPMGTALQNTGGAALVADGIVASLGSAPPVVLLAGIFGLTMVFSQFISNTATTILLAPIVYQAAELLSLSPYPIFVMVAAGASSAFLTPIASPVNTLILGPGNLRFFDFARDGLPLVLIVLVVGLLWIPFVWGF